jgi:hypothetical protein
MSRLTANLSTAGLSNRHVIPKLRVLMVSQDPVRLFLAAKISTNFEAAENENGAQQVNISYTSTFITWKKSVKRISCN